MRISYWSSDVCSSDLGLDALGLGGKGRKVAVIDSGVDVDHADLAGRLVDEACFCSPVSGGAGCCPNMTATQTGPGAAVDDLGTGSNVDWITYVEGSIAPRGAVRNTDARPIGKGGARPGR